MTWRHEQEDCSPIVGRESPGISSRIDDAFPALDHGDRLAPTIEHHYAVARYHSTMDGLDPLQDRRWCLRAIVLEGNPVDGVEGAGAYIVLGSDNGASGRGGCNRCFGREWRPGDALRGWVGDPGLPARGTGPARSIEKNGAMWSVDGSSLPQWLRR
jgi:hypothetical protein